MPDKKQDTIVEPWQALDELCCHEPPEWVTGVTTETITFNAGADWSGYKEHEISIDDVIEYYTSQAPNISSGCRTLGTIVGDWREIDALAKFALEYFKIVNVETLREKGRAAGLEPKF